MSGQVEVGRKPFDCSGILARLVRAVGSAPRSLLLLVAMAPGPATAALEDWHFEASAATDKVQRGLDLSDRHPYAEAAASWYAGLGPFADFSVSSFALSRNATPAGALFVADAGYGWRLEQDWSAQVMVSHHQTWGTPAAQSMNYQELVLTAGWRDGVFASVAVSPRASIGSFQPTRTVAYDLVGRLPLVHGLTAVAGIGYYDLRAAIGTGYGYGNVGLSYQRGALQLDLMYVGTAGSAKSRFNGALDNRWVGLATWHF